MSRHGEITLTNGRRWIVGAIFTTDRGEVVVPLNQIEGMSDADIGATVRALADQADYCCALEIADYFMQAQKINLSDPDYPRMRETLMRHWGTDDQITVALMTCQTAEDRERLAAAQLARKNKPDLRAGFVYLLKAGPYYKIGRSVNVDNRLTQLAIQLPERPELVCSFQARDMVETERRLHHMFGHKRLNGEWFSLDDHDIGRIRALFEV